MKFYNSTNQLSADIIAIKRELEPIQKQLNEHPLYSKLVSHTNLVTFMSHHLFCVWDFMNLLKKLQVSITCVELPWKPKSHPKLVRLINEIVLEEESDFIDGRATSHFEYYCDALTLIAPSNNVIKQFLTDLKEPISYADLISKNYIPKDVAPFLKFTYESTQSSLLHTAASFTFGREALVPDLFKPIITLLNRSKNTDLQKFSNYLERHVELDGGSHSYLAYELVESLCHLPSDWETVKNQARNTLQARLNLWNELSKLF